MSTQNQIAYEKSLYEQKIAQYKGYRDTANTKVRQHTTLLLTHYPKNNHIYVKDAQFLHDQFDLLYALLVQMEKVKLEKVVAEIESQMSEPLVIDVHEKATDVGLFLVRTSNLETDLLYLSNKFEDVSRQVDTLMKKKAGGRDVTVAYDTTAMESDIGGRG